VRIEKLHDLLVRLYAHPRRRLTLLVGVDGPPGSGKSSFARALATLDHGLELVEVDQFRPVEGETPAPTRGGHPGDVNPAFDWRRLRGQVLLPLSRDARARYQAYDPARERLGAWREIAVGGVVLVEGAHSCMRQLATFYDFRIWVDSPHDVRRRRLREKGVLDGTVEAPHVSEETARDAHLRVDGSALLDVSLQYARVL
jgi:uridine kinase